MSAHAGFVQMALHTMRLPADAHVIGEPVTVTQIRDSGLPYVGVLAICERGGARHEVSLAEVHFAPGSPGAIVVARYRAWLGLPVETGQPPRGATAHEVASTDIALGEPVELIVLACKSNALRCRLRGTHRELTLRTAVRDEIPGSIVNLVPTKQWTHARHPYLSGKLSSMRDDVSALGLAPLALRAEGDWDPDDEHWGEEGEPIAEWAEPIIARGTRPMFEMEQVLPGSDPDDFESDPILEASELRAAGDVRGAHDRLMGLLAKDLRCLDAYAHLGNLEFDRDPRRALRLYEMGLAIGELTLGKDFEGVLAWGLIDNRPFLRCLHGAGLAAWRLDDRDRATAALERLLWLNPADNQGARFDLAEVRAGMPWRDERG